MSGIILQSVKDKRILAKAEQGATWTLYIHLTDQNQNDIDLTNYTVRSHIKRKYTDTTPTAVFNCYIINSTEGKIQISLEANETAKIPKGTYVMDVEIESEDHHVTRILEGTLIVTPEVTK